MVKKWTPVIIALLMVFSGCSKPKVTQTPSAPQTTSIPGVLEYSLDDTAIFSNDLRSDQAGIVSRYPLTDIYLIEVNLGDDLTGLNGHMKVRYFNRLDADLGEVYFRLLPNLWGLLMQVSTVSVNGIAITPRLENDDTALYIPLKKTVTSGGHTDIDLDFEVIIPQDDSGNYGTFGYQKGILALAQFYPLIPLRDENGWRIELYPPDGDVTVTEVANYLVRISAPENLKMAATGIQISREVKDGRQVITQVAALSREFYMAGSADYLSQTLARDGIEYTIYSNNGVAPAAKESLDYIINAVDIFTQRYGEYPYRELECVATPTSAGGVEYPGIMAINQVLFDPDEMLSGMSASALIESVIVHEVAHEWFYNIVGNDQGREPWLDEAMAQYLTYQYFHDRYNASVAGSFEESWWSRWDRVQRETKPIGLPVEAYEGREYGAIVYGRGPLFLEALSREMGEAKFDQFLKDYFTTYAWKVATTQDFQSRAEETCGCDLDPIFNEWVYMK
ncbi:MAG: M1 family metallopeptidase [Anaerolineaceae bacterium]